LTTGVVGVVCALRSEARHWGPLASRHAAFAALTDGTLVAVGGVGMPAATRAALRLVADGAGALVSFGMAGGLDPRLTAGTILLADQVVCAGSPARQTSSGWTSRVRGALAPAQRVAGGTLLSTAVAVTGVAEKARLLRDSGAAAVDMESAAIVQVAQEAGLPCIVVRVIVDLAADELPALVQDAAGAQGEIRLARLLGSLARRPAQVVPLLRLSQRYREANRALAAAAGTEALHTPPARAAHP
jgi:adenosylhomocysteine nucleosidase